MQMHKLMYGCNAKINSTATCVGPGCRIGAPFATEALLHLSLQLTALFYRDPGGYLQNGHVLIFHSNRYANTLCLQQPKGGLTLPAQWLQSMLHHCNSQWPNLQHLHLAAASCLQWWTAAMGRSYACHMIVKLLSKVNINSMRQGTSPDIKNSPNNIC